MVKIEKTQRGKGVEKRIARAKGLGFSSALAGMHWVKGANTDSERDYSFISAHGESAKVDVASGIGPT